MSVQNKKTSIEDVQAVVDEVIVNTVFDIFDSVLRINTLQDLFKDLSEKLITELAAQSFMEYDLELTEDQRVALIRVVAANGNDTVRHYLSNINKDERTQKVYDIVKEKTRSIADAVLSAIGKEINRGAIINAVAVQANAKSEDYDEIQLRKTKTSGDITIPTNCILISTNCVSVIKASCQRQTTEQKRNGEDTPEEVQTEAAEQMGEEPADVVPEVVDELDISLPDDEPEDDEE